MSRRRARIAITVLAIAVALSLQANASIVPHPEIAYGSTSNQILPMAITPSPTQEQKDAALKIAATSPLCKQYNAYPDGSWRASWSGAPDDKIVLVSKELLGGDYTLYITVDLNTGSIVKAECDQIVERADPFSSGTTALTSNMFSSAPSISAGNSLFNMFSTSPLTDNSELQPSTTSGNNETSSPSQPFSIFSKSLNTFPAFGSGTQLFSIGGLI